MEYALRQSGVAMVIAVASLRCGLCRDAGRGWAAMPRDDFAGKDRWDALVVLGLICLRCSRPREATAVIR